MALTKAYAFTDDATIAATMFYGFTCAETAGAAARVLLRDGSSSGAIFADIKLAAGESVFGPVEHPVVMQAGNIYVDVDTGAVRGAVWAA